MTGDQVLTSEKAAGGTPPSHAPVAVALSSSAPLPLGCPALPPRQLTPRANWRAWTEPSVRLWWLMAVAVLVAILIYGGDRLAARRVENRLVADGVPVTARATSNAYHAVTGQTVDAGQEMTVQFPWHGQPMETNGFLTRSTTVGAPVQLRVDPADPTVWTDQTEPTPILHAVFTGLLLLPVVAVLATVAVARQGTVARTYRFGASAVGVVLDRRQTPIAPLSHAVRCSLRDGSDRRIRTVHVPPAGRSLAKGDELWLLLPPKGRGRPVAAMWFE